MLKIILSIFMMIPLASSTESLPLDRSKRIQYTFNNLSKENMDLNDQFYDEKVVFIDPIGKIKGLTTLKEYYAKMYDSVESIRFDIIDETIQENTHIIEWDMYLKTPKLNGGREFVVPGMSKIRFNEVSDKVIYHRDSFDMGVFIYERLPVIGRAIRYIKSRFKHEN